MKNFTFRKLAIAAIAILIMSATASAQEEKATTIGVKAGGIFGKGSRVGFKVGATVDQSISPNWELLTGLDYSRIYGLSEGITVHVAPLRLPVYIGRKLTTRVSDITLYAGPYLGYLLSAGMKIDLMGIKENFDFIEEEVMKRLHFGLGLGWKVDYGKYWTGCEFDLGLANSVNKKKYDDLADIKWTNFNTGNFSIIFGYNF